ncbi:MAG: lactoylglutathione lyase [SAR86 cluster bacterium]|uniref:Lactoylglutathione lyase n=1 Tax=SAR86 cluster bacterium TaxID=2030880 RepID=A0A2A4WUT1_9GAMM|nr:MAG: lactoylglutathione lyase [SAR86 cluster bacterium]
MVIKISVSIDVPNLKEAEAFYTEALGCKKVRDQGSNMVVLSVENSDIYLQEKEPRTKPLVSSSVVRSYERHWTPIHLDFLCDNVDELVTRILELGGSHEGGESGDWGSIAYCADPFGNGFCIINE